MKSFIEQAQLYAQYHEKELTRYTHLVGVPLIIFSSMVLLGFLHLIIPGKMNITLASLFTLLLLAYYFRLNWRLALVATPLFIILLGLAKLVSSAGPTRFALWIFIISFVLGWTMQFLGHLYEKKWPAIVDNFCQAFIAPLFLIAELLFKAGYLSDLKAKIYPEFSSMAN